MNLPRHWHLDFWLVGKTGDVLNFSFEITKPVALNYVSVVLYHGRKLWERFASRDHSSLKNEIGGNKGMLFGKNFASKMYGTMKNKQVKDNSVEESRSFGQAVFLGRLSSQGYH